MGTEGGGQKTYAIIFSGPTVIHARYVMARMHYVACFSFGIYPAKFTGPDASQTCMTNCSSYYIQNWIVYAIYENDLTLSTVQYDRRIFVRTNAQFLLD